MPQDTQFIAGLSDLDAALKEFGPKLAKKGLRRAMSQGGVVVREEMRRRAPRQAAPKAPKSGGVIYGPLWKRIRTSLRFDRRDFAINVKAGPGKSVAWYAEWLEFGNSRQKARPFLRPAWEAKKSVALDKIVAELKSMVTKIASEVRK